jgi:hypothetical protein
MATKGNVGTLLVAMRADLSGLRFDVSEMQKTFQSSFSNIQNQAANFGRTLAGSLGIGLSVGSIIAFTKEVIQLGSHLKDLEAQTGVSVQTLSGMKSVLEENGASLEGFALGMFRLQKELGTVKNDADPTAQAIKALGLNLKELQNVGTEEMLKQITDALGKQENILNRNALAYQLMQRGARELVPALLAMAGQIDDLKKKGLTPEDVKILDDFADSWTRASNAVKIFAATDIAGVIKEFSKDWQTISVSFSKMPDFLQSFTSLTKGIQNTEKELLTFYQILLGILRVAPLLTEFLTFGKLDFGSKRFTDWIAQIQKWKDEIGKPAPTGAVATAPTAPFKPPLDDAAAKKLESVIEGIQKENDKLQAQIIELEHGKAASDDYALSQKEIEERSKGISAALTKEQQTRRDLTGQLRLEVRDRDDLRRLAEQTRKETPFVEETTHFGLTPEEQKEFIDNENKMREETDKLKKSWADLQIQTSIGIISDETQRKVTEITQQFIDLALKAQALGEALGKTPEQISAMVSGIWEPFKRQIGDITKIKTDADKLGEEIANSISDGLRNTLEGVELGTQSLGDAMKNLLRNMMLELQRVIFEKGFLDPLKAVAAGFISGLVGALNEQANKDLFAWAKTLGANLRSWLSESLGGLFGSTGGQSVGLLTGIVGAEYSRGGPIPAFASGGLFIGHGGEFVMQRSAVDSIGAGNMAAMNATGRLPGQSGTAVNVVINGSITPNDPNATKEQIIQVVMRDLDDRGRLMRTVEKRIRRS